MKGMLLGSGGGVWAHGHSFLRALTLTVAACAALWMPSCTSSSAGSASPAPDAAQSDASDAAKDSARDASTDTRANH